MAAPARDLDVVLLGATGFTGRLVAEYLAGTVPAGIRVGLAGRSGEAVRQVRAGLGERAAAWDVLVADTGDERSLREMARRARVVASTVGPYAHHGLPVVDACASLGTDYLDITGEVLFMRDSIDRYDAVAREHGVRVVHGCGFDSIPSDLGVWDLAQRADEDGAGLLEDTTLVVDRMRGGVSGGTLASARAEIAAVRHDAGRRSVLTDPYALSPDRGAEPDLGDQSDLRRAVFDDDLGQWVGPFVMGTINTRVVRRSNALLGHRYGRRFRYREVMGLGDEPGAAARGAAAADSWGGPGAGAAQPPRPGEGPDEQARRRGFFRMSIHTRTSSGARYVERVAADGDPGYAATCVMVGQATLCLAQDAARLPATSGVLTPAVAFGSVLVDRLRDAGMTFQAQAAPAVAETPPRS